MDKCREQFEAWAINTKDQFGVPFFTIKNANGKYVDHGTEISWQAWQASRQALVVELPKNGEPVFKNDFAEGVSSGADIYRSAVEYALDKQGIKYK